MPEESKHSQPALWLGLFLTFSIALIKGGVPAWVSLSWVSLCCVSLWVALTLEPNLNRFLVRWPKNGGAFSLNPFYYFIAFQVWALAQTCLLSLDESASLDKTLIGLGMLCLLLIWKNALKYPEAKNTLFTTLIFFSLMQSLYGLWVYLSNTNLLLWMPKLYYLDRPTGFFVNANHFAAYIVLAIILCLSALLANKPQKAQDNILIKLFDSLYSPINITLCVLIGALIASKSIGAIISLSAVLGIISVRTIWLSKQRMALLLGGITLVFIALIAILTLDYSLIEKEVSGLVHTFSRRYDLSQAAFTMLKDTWLLGVGGGSFYSQFSPYRTLDIGNTYYNYAHNDLLQFWIEYGLIGISLLVLFVASVLRDNFHILRKHGHTQMEATFAYAAIFSTIAVTVHSLVDFPLHIPGFSVCYLVVISANSLSLFGSQQ